MRRLIFASTVLLALLTSGTSQAELRALVVAVDQDAPSCPPSIYNGLDLIYRNELI